MKPEIFKANGKTFASYKQLVNYCIENGYRGSETSEIEYKTVIVNLVNLQSITS